MSDEMVSNWLVILVVLTALFFVRKYRAKIESESAEGYRNVTGGLVILTVTGLARVYNGLGLFASVPFLSIPIFFDLAYWIGVITGSALIFNGVANWIPQVRNQNQTRRERLEPLLVLKQVEQLIGVESRPDKLMAGAVSMISRLTNASSGAAICCSDRSPVPTLVATEGRPPFDPRYFDEMQPSERVTQASRPLVNRPSLPAGTERPDLNLPLFANRELFGWLLFWGARSTKLAADDLQTVRLAADALARVIDQRNVQKEFEQEVSWSFDLENLTQRVTAAGNSNDRFALFCRSLSQWLDFDWAALSVWERGSEHGTRVSVNRMGRSLVERQHRIPRVEQITGQAYHGGPAVMVTDLSQETRPGYDEILSDGDLQSLVAWPLGQFGEYRAVLILASAGSDLADQERTPKTLKRLSGVLREVVWPAVGQRFGTAHRAVDTDSVEVDNGAGILHRNGVRRFAESENFIG